MEAFHPQRLADGEHDAADCDPICGLLGRRSPGSALKPFIYALTIDEGLIHPRTMLKDTAQNFNICRAYGIMSGHTAPNLIRALAISQFCVCLRI